MSVGASQSQARREATKLHKYQPQKIEDFDGMMAKYRRELFALYLEKYGVVAPSKLKSMKDHEVENYVQNLGHHSAFLEEFALPFPGSIITAQDDQKLMVTHVKIWVAPHDNFAHVFWHVIGRSVGKNGLVGRRLLERSGRNKV